uniref:Retrotransposon gag domain-containing protein n=1 Tax=Tanacetum cinerariifolium TaxID=118510 RepID=A0A6L2KQN4_TANCI|nr:hypothetical protein [Tanacetum cinerariifolium]
MQELREDTFFGNENKDAHDHVDRVLNIVSLFNILGVSQDAVLLRVFPFTLTGSTKRWVDKLTLGAVSTWDLLKKRLSKVFIHYPRPLNDLKTFTTSSRKVMNHYTKLGNGPFHGMTPTQALTAIQIMADHSQKWHDGTSSKNVNRNSNTNGLAAIISKLDNLGCDMKKLKENVHAIQVGCQICERPLLDKECPLNVEVKQVEEIKYGEFGRPAPFNGSNGAKFRLGPPGYYNRTNNQSPYGEKRLSLEELMNKHQEESARRSPKWMNGLRNSKKMQRLTLGTRAPLLKI